MSKVPVPVPTNIIDFRSIDGKPLRVPHNIEAEQAFLGAVLVNNEALYRAGDVLRAEHFYEPLHQDIFDVIAKIVHSGKAATPITVKSHLPDKVTDDTPMVVYLARLAGGATTVVNAPDYAAAIIEQAQRRDLANLSSDMAHQAYFADIDTPAIVQIDNAERTLYAMAESAGARAGFMSFDIALRAAITMAGEAYSRDGTLSGLATNLADLDRLMGGLQKSDLIIVAGRPVMGKTALATGVGFHVAKTFRPEQQPDGTIKAKDGGRVGFFSLEMSAEQLATRILAEQAGISSSDIRRGNIHERQFSDLVDASNLIATIPLYIDDTGGLDVHQLVSRARRLKRQKGIDLLIIDYLQLLRGSVSKQRENRVAELTEITTTLKALAKDLDIPIIALSQLSRAVESRDDKHPQLADLRESGSIEQDADVVLFVYREEYYLKNKEPKEGTPEHLAWSAEMEKVHGRAEVIIGKQRHGPTGIVQVAFDAPFTRFGNLARSEYLPERVS